jgi:hypothetical protein
MRQANASTTLNVYCHLRLDKDDSPPAVIAVVFATRADRLADFLRTSSWIIRP